MQTLMGDVTPDSNQQTGCAFQCEFLATCVEGVGRQHLVRGVTGTQAAGCTSIIWTMGLHGRYLHQLLQKLYVHLHFVTHCHSLQDLKDHMRGAGGQVEYVKIMQDFDGRPKVLNKLAEATH